MTQKIFPLRLRPSMCDKKIKIANSLFLCLTGKYIFPIWKYYFRFLIIMHDVFVHAIQLERKTIFHWCEKLPLHILPIPLLLI